VQEARTLAASGFDFGSGGISIWSRRDQQCSAYPGKGHSAKLGQDALSAALAALHVW